MSNEIKTAIKSAEERLDHDRSEKLQTEIYQFLKGELEAIDSIESKIRKLSEEKRVHEENVKNIKQGNLEAIERRHEAYPVSPNIFTYTLSNASNTIPTGWRFYDSFVAGTVIEVNGKKFIF